MAVVEAVAAVTDRNPLDIAPLYDRVDGDALDALVTRGSGDLRLDVQVTFPYEGCEVTVDGDGNLSVSVD